MVKWKVAPLLSSDSIQMVPPKISTIPFDIDKPKPEPALTVNSSLSDCLKRSKISWWSFSEMPTPES